MPELQKQIAAYLKANAANLSLNHKAQIQQTIRIIAANPAAMDGDEAPENEEDEEGEDEDAEAMDEDEDAEAMDEDDEPEAMDEDEDAEAMDEDDEPEAKSQKRIFAILDHPEAKGRAKLARTLAKQGHSVKAAVAILKSAPKSNVAINQIRANAQKPLNPAGGGSGQKSSIVTACENLAKKQA